jgi:TATA-box binding protein (TBP) (component of TFIID and TFIIIB)
MLKFQVVIDTRNDAFVEGGGHGIELARILRELATTMENEPERKFPGLLFDVNGNKVGRFGFGR